MLTALLQILFFFTAVLFTYIWTQNSTLNPYTLQIIAALVIFFSLASWWQKKKQKKLNTTVYFNIFIFSLVTLLLIFSTGTLSSPFFFLTYFLLFLTSLLISPQAGLIFSSVLLLVFLLTQPMDIREFVTAVSLLIIAPLAYLMGKLYLQVLKDKNQLKTLKQTNQKQSHNISSEETNSLLFLSLNLEENLLSIIESLQYSLSQPQIKGQPRIKLEKAHQKAKNLLEEGRFLKEKIDQQTDE